VAPILLILWPDSDWMGGHDRIGRPWPDSLPWIRQWTIISELLWTAAAVLLQAKCSPDTQSTTLPNQQSLTKRASHIIHIILLEKKACVVADLITASSLLKMTHYFARRQLVFTSTASSLTLAAVCHAQYDHHFALSSAWNEGCLVRQLEFLVALESVATLRLVVLRWTLSLTALDDLHPTLRLLT